VSLESELTVASMGLAPILRSTPRIGVGQSNDAAAWLPRARALLLRFLGGGSEKGSEQPPFDYKDVSALLEADEDEIQDRSDALYTVLPPEQVDDVVASATKAVDYLQQSIPKRVWRTVVNAHVDPPGPIDMDRFRRRWMVAADPAVVLRDLLRGAIDPVMVDAFAEMYPELYKALQAVCDEAIATMKARRGEKWDINATRDRDLRTLLRAPAINLGIVNALSQAQEPLEQGQPAGGPQAKAVNSRLTDAEKLPGQKGA
jgi:hypothetical protein